MGICSDAEDWIGNVEWLGRIGGHHDIGRGRCGLFRLGLELDPMGSDSATDE